MAKKKSASRKKKGASVKAKAAGRRGVKFGAFNPPFSGKAGRKK
jgi:hypothetical protein